MKYEEKKRKVITFEKLMYSDLSGQKNLDHCVSVTIFQLLENCVFLLYQNIQINKFHHVVMHTLGGSVYIYQGTLPKFEPNIKIDLFNLKSKANLFCVCLSFGRLKFWPVFFVYVLLEKRLTK